MTAPSPNPMSQVVLRAADEPEEHAAAMHPLEAELLCPVRAPIHASILGLSLDNIGLQFNRQDTPVIGRVAPPLGMSALAVCLSISKRSVWHGRPVNDQVVVSYAGGAEHVSHSDGGFLVAILLTPDITLARDAIRLGLTNLPQRRGTTEFLEPDTAAIRALRITLQRAMAVAKEGRVLEFDGARSGLSATLTRIAATAISGEHLAPRVRDASVSRTAIVWRANEYLDSRQAEPVYIADLCAATGSSERTLRYAFLDVYGVGPNRYLQLRRLHAARRILRGRPAPTSVTKVATELGFWDIGRFAEYYRRLFGELPSETLRNASGKEAEQCQDQSGR